MLLDLNIFCFKVKMEEDNQVSSLKKRIKDKSLSASVREQLQGALISLLREKLKDKTLTHTQKQEYREELINLIKERGLVKLPTGEPPQFHIIYDTFGQGLEPVYFWTLDFMRNDPPNGLNLEVNKIEEEFEASVGGGYYGEMGARASVMQDRAMNILGKVNDIVRIIINLIYDLKEFEIRLKNYDELSSTDKDVKQAAKFALKAVWMDQVDIKKGRGSINMLTQDLQFVTLRDAFMFCEDRSLKGPGGKEIDLNDRVKRILKLKIDEYLRWKEYSEKELRKRYEVEKAYLKSQVASLRLYTKWARPYLIAAQKLGMKEFKTKAGLPTPDIVTAFSNMQMQLTLIGKKKIDPRSVHTRYARMRFKHEIYSCLEIEFRFRTIPRSLRAEGGSHYLHSGTIDIFFRPYAFTEQDIEDLERLEAVRDLDLVEDLTELSLAELQEDLDTYLREPEKKEEKEKKKFKWPFGNMFSGFRENISAPMKEVFKGLKIAVVPEKEGYTLKEIRKYAGEKALDTCLITYDVFKKSHGMTTW